MNYPATIDRPSIFKGMGPASLRVPENRGALQLPLGTILVSTDNHWSVSEDIFYRGFPAHLKDAAPRLWQSPEGAWLFTVSGEPAVPQHTHRLFAEMDLVAGSSIIEARLKDMDIEGIDKELAFGNVIAAFYTHPDLEVRNWIFRIYNQHLAEMQAKAPGRFYGVGLVNYWDPRQARASLDEIKRLGIKTVVLPQTPRTANREPINYCARDMWPFWEAIEEAGLPICFHVGEAIQDGPGGVALSVLLNLSPFRKNFGELIFGGVLDRHPGIRAVFVEADIYWVPGALQHADMIYETYAHELDPKIRHHPRHYWENNLYATVISDPAGLRLIDEIGADRIMWGNDYPHQESVYGCSWQSVRQILDAVPAGDAVKILGGTALDLFDLR